MPEISVVIPSFRGGWLLREAIASVQTQTFENWELIIVFDGCDDDLSDIERADPRVRSIHQARRGAAVARNVGIHQATAELVALLDDDDRMLPDRLRLQSAAMDDETVVITHTQYRVIGPDGRILRDGDAAETSYLDFLRGASHVMSGTAMFRKRSFQEVGGYNSVLQFGEGQDLIFRIAREGRICFVPEVLYEYRQHDSNVWFGSSSGSEETALVLRQHFFAARARGETENLRAVRRGMSSVPKKRVAAAIGRASDAKSRHSYPTLVGALAWAFVLSPIFTAKVILKGLANRGQQRRI